MSPEQILDVRQRADAGDADAIAFTAVLAGMGVGEPQSWAEALTRLGRAAERGSSSAMGQLAVFGAAAGTAGGDWAGAAAAIDIEAWLAPPARERLLLDPRISAARGHLPPLACQWVIGRAKGRITAATVFDPVSGGGRQEAGRTNSAFEFAFNDLDLVMAAVRARIAATVGVPAGALESIQVLHYAAGQAFARHHDFLDVSVPGYAIDVARWGQRIATFLIYLNDGYAGGETDFPLLDLKFKGSAGDALMFANVDLAGAPDRRTLHAGLPPLSGEKWLLSQWIRDRARV